MTAEPTVEPSDPSGFPSAETTGVPEGTELTQTSGYLVITEPGTTIDGLDLDGTIRVEADDVTIRSSWIHGSGWWSIEVADGLTGVVIEHCDLDGQGEADGAENSMGVMGPATVRYNDIRGVENGVTPFSGSVVTDNYIHDLGAPGDPHYDGIQIDGAVQDVLIDHNTIVNDFDQTSAVMIANDFGPADSITVSNNYLAGGGYTVYSDAQFDGGPITNVRFIDNAFIIGHWGYASIEGNTPEGSGNYDAETGEPITLY